MIIFNPENGQTLIQFGIGDINIVPGVMKEENVGLLILRHQEPGKIGIHNGRVDPPKKMSEIPVIMQFTKAESIDVLIYGLKQTKEMMLNKNKWLNNNVSSVKNDITNQKSKFTQKS